MLRLSSHSCQNMAWGKIWTGPMDPWTIGLFFGPFFGLFFGPFSGPFFLDHFLLGKGGWEGGVRILYIKLSSFFVGEGWVSSYH